MKLFYPILLGILFITISACSNASEQSSDNVEAGSMEEMLPAVMALPIVEELEAAHKAPQFKQKQAVSLDIELYFRGKKRLEGTLISTPNSDGIRIEKKDGTVLAYDGEQVWMSPAPNGVGGARFDVFTWQYFFMAPFKLSDPGTNWEAMDDMMFEGEAHTTAKLTFDNDTGDAPDDWYIAYKDKNTNLLDAMAYIVTFGASQEEAEEEPHAISYHNYKEVEGIPIATEWEFWLWTEEKGLFDQLGEAKISNVKFVKVDESTFAAPEDSKEVGR